MSRHTSIRIGGPADYYLEPVDLDDFLKLMKYLEEQRYPAVIIGRGTNLLVSDEGIRGAVINLEKTLSRIAAENETVIAEAGAGLAALVDFCLKRGLSGLEKLAGIPGTVGGAVIMNAGAWGDEISDHITELEIFRSGSVVKIFKEHAGFGYRRSGFEDDIVLKATFKLTPGDATMLEEIRRELLTKRGKNQPLNSPNFGCTFRNPADSSAAKLLQEAGLKGAKRGDAQISEKHANFIVNLGSASAADVIGLIAVAKTTVQKKFGINLVPEVKLYGFAENILKDIPG